MNRLLTSVMVGLAGIQGITLAAEPRPKLVVGIMVDQLRTDYIENLKDMFATGGFRRLMDQGLYLKDVDFGVVPGDAASASAIIQTGEFPRFNGVTGNFIYDPETKSLQPIFSDKAFIGNFTNETYSPNAMRVTTVTDEIALDGKGGAKVHSIAPDAAQAIVLAGHAANSAFWVNDESGKWSSTTYYSNPPAPLQNRNYHSPLVSRLDTMKWVPLRKGEPYPDIQSKELKEGFKYTFSRSDRDVIANYKASPFVNHDVTTAASEYISGLQLGKNNETIDVLNIAYTLAPYPQVPDADYKYELQDAYLRLDKDLEQLLNDLDKNVGRENVLVYLFSTGYFAEPVLDTSVYRLPGGTFSVKRAMSLLNSFFAAKYGNGSYVDKYYNRNFYFNKNILEEKNLDLNSVSREAREFLVKMSGIADAYTASELMEPRNIHLDAERLAIDPKTSGDVIVEFNPGWKIVDDTAYPAQTQLNKTVAYPAPGFILGKEVAARKVETPVDATAIAPTIARILRIRSPNSATTHPLPLK